MAKVVEELDEADNAGKLSTPIRYKESTNDLPYYNAVLKEAMRIHPSVGLLMERHVPAEGIKIDGHFIPGGTIVGINPWVTNRDPAAFPDAEEFKPERWLEASEAHLKQMDSILELNFGGGSRKCIGRNICEFFSFRFLCECTNYLVLAISLYCAVSEKLVAICQDILSVILCFFLRSLGY